MRFSTFPERSVSLGGLLLFSLASVPQSLGRVGLMWCGVQIFVLSCPLCCCCSSPCSLQRLGLCLGRCSLWLFCPLLPFPPISLHLASSLCHCPCVCVSSSRCLTLRCVFCLLSSVFICLCHHCVRLRSFICLLVCLSPFLPFSVFLSLEVGQPSVWRT